MIPDLFILFQRKPSILHDLFSRSQKKKKRQTAYWLDLQKSCVYRVIVLRAVWETASWWHNCPNAKAFDNGQKLCRSWLLGSLRPPSCAWLAVPGTKSNDIIDRVKKFMTNERCAAYLKSSKSIWSNVKRWHLNIFEKVVKVVGVQQNLCQSFVANTFS